MSDYGISENSLFPHLYTRLLFWLPCDRIHVQLTVLLPCLWNRQSVRISPCGLPTPWERCAFGASAERAKTNCSTPESSNGDLTRQPSPLFPCTLFPKSQEGRQRCGLPVPITQSSCIRLTLHLRRRYRSLSQHCVCAFPTLTSCAASYLSTNICCCSLGLRMNKFGYGISKNCFKARHPKKEGGRRTRTQRCLNEP